MRPLTDKEREIVAKNLPLATTLANAVAKRYRFDMRRHGDDLIQAAAIGLMQAVQSHKPEKGTLATHAGWRARGAVTREWQASFPIRLPGYQWENANPGNPYESEADLARNVATLDAPADNADHHHPTAPTDEYDEREQVAHLLEQLYRALPLLPDLDREIIEARFFRGEHFRVIGERIGKSRETIAIYVDRAVKKLARLLEAESWD